MCLLLQLELFEREAQTLEALQHPGIPRYLESFEKDTATDRGYFLVQVGICKHCCTQRREGSLGSCCQ